MTFIPPESHLGSPNEETSDEPGYQPFPSFETWLGASFNPSIFEHAENKLLAKRVTSDPNSLREAVQRATRSAAVDTGAIEGLYTVDRGFTFSVATQAATWESMVEHKGEPVRRAIDDALRAYEYVLDAATQKTVISQMWIRQLHEIICASQETYSVMTDHGMEERSLTKGAYKTQPNSPWNPSTGNIHEYAPVWDTAPEMQRLVDELRSDAFNESHPVLQASYAHYAYVCVHPFPDGNGRVARALASVFLYRRPGTPLVIFADQRGHYFDALEAADKGRYEGFINFIESCALDTLGIVTAQLRPEAPSALASLADLANFYKDASDEIAYFDAATRLSKLAYAEFTRQAEELPFPPHIRWDVFSVYTNTQLIDGYMHADKDANFCFRLMSHTPTEASVSVIIGALVGKHTDAADIALVSNFKGDVLEVTMREIEPTVTEALRLKVSAWVEAQVTLYIFELQKAVAKARLI